MPCQTAGAGLAEVDRRSGTLWEGCSTGEEDDHVVDVSSIVDVEDEVGRVNLLGLPLHLREKFKYEKLQQNGCKSKFSTSSQPLKYIQQQKLFLGILRLHSTGFLGAHTCRKIQCWDHLSHMVISFVVENLGRIIQEVVSNFGFQNTYRYMYMTQDYSNRNV